MFIRLWKPLPSKRVFKTLRESPKRTIFVSGRLELLQKVSEPDTKQCVIEEAEPRRGWTQDGVSARTLGPEEGGLGVAH